MRPKRRSKLPPYLGSTLRGALGHALRKIACLPMCRDPKDCILRERCAYAYCFETHVPKGSSVLRNLEYIPHPLVLEPPALRPQQIWEEGEDLRFALIFVGKAIGHFPYFVAAVDRMASTGLGKDRSPFELIEVREAAEKDNDPNLPMPLWSKTDGKIRALRERDLPRTEDAACEEVEIEFLTPLRLVVDGKHSVRFEFRDLARALLARLSSLMYFHCGQEIRAEFNEILDAASQVSLKSHSLHVQSLHRWSNRQKADIRLDGIVGRVCFSGPTLRHFIELLGAGEIFHVGKGTIFGLGKYRLMSSERKVNNG